MTTHQLELSMFEEALNNTSWTSSAMSAVRVLAASGQPFEINAVRDLHVEEPPTPNLWGVLARRAVREGLIRCVGVGPSKSPSRRGSLTRTYGGTGR